MPNSGEGFAVQSGQPSARRRPIPRRVWLGCAGLSVAAAAAVILWPRPQPDFRDQVDRAVAAGVPVGTPIEQAHGWIWADPSRDDVTQYGPAGLPLHRLHGRSAAECAGVPPDGLREVTCFRVQARGRLGVVTDRAWVYLLVGADGRVRGHYVTTDDPHPDPTPPAPSPRPWWRIW